MLSESQMRRWVRGWWADQMRKGTLPDVPEEFDVSDPIREKFERVWTEESARLAQIMAPK